MRRISRGRLRMKGVDGASSGYPGLLSRFVIVLRLDETPGRLGW